MGGAWRRLTCFFQQIATSTIVGEGPAPSEPGCPRRLAGSHLNSLTRVFSFFFFFFKEGTVYFSAGSTNQTLHVLAAPAAVEEPPFLVYIFILTLIKQLFSVCNTAPKDFQ